MATHPDVSCKTASSRPEADYLREIIPIYIYIYVCVYIYIYIEIVNTLQYASTPFLCYEFT